MTLLTDEVRSFIGAVGTTETACDRVEEGAVRRYAHACMDASRRYLPTSEDPRLGGPVAPPLYPMNMFRRAADTSDPFEERARDPHFDGIVGSTAQGLPTLPLPTGTGLLNAGTEVEIFRYARIGDTVTAISRYADISEKTTSKGPMLLVVIETEYRNGGGELLLRVRKTQIRR
jgi:hypothetical protein